MSTYEYRTTTPQYLATIELNSEAQDFGTMDLSYLTKAKYDPAFKNAVADAKLVSVSELKQLAPQSTPGKSASLRVQYCR